MLNCPWQSVWVFLLCRVSGTDSSHHHDLQHGWMIDSYMTFFALETLQWSCHLTTFHWSVIWNVQQLYTPSSSHSVSYLYFYTSDNPSILKSQCVWTAASEQGRLQLTDGAPCRRQRHSVFDRVKHFHLTFLTNIKPTDSSKQHWQTTQQRYWFGYTPSLTISIVPIFIQNYSTVTIPATCDVVQQT